MNLIKLHTAQNNNIVYVNIDSMISIQPNQKDYLYGWNKYTDKNVTEILGTEILLKENNRILVKESVEEIMNKMNL
jgi:hypothetical protein